MSKKSENPFEQYQAQFLEMWNENLAKVPGGDAIKEYQDKLVETWQEGLEKVPGADTFKEYQAKAAEAWQKSLDALPGSDQIKQYQEQVVDTWKKGLENLQQLPGAEQFKDLQDQILDTWKKGLDNLQQLPGAEQFKAGAEQFKAYQEKLADAWKKNFGKVPTAESMQEMYTAMLPDTSDYWKMMSPSMPGMTEYWESLAKMMPDPTTFFKGTPYKIPGLDNYAKMFDLWRGMNDPVSFAQDFQTKYMDIMQDLFKGFLPEGANQLMERPLEFMDTCVNYYKQNFAPLLKVDDEILSRIAQGDLSAYTDFFRDFNSRYEETIGKYYNMVGLGLNRESNEDFMKAMSTYNKTMFATGELMSMIMTTTAESATKLSEKFQELIQEGTMPTTFREFYDLWSSTTESELTNLLDTDEFAKTFDNFADMYSQYMIANNKVLERMLASLPIPTNTDMKSLYKTVYDLRKEVRDLKRELRELKSSK